MKFKAVIFDLDGVVTKTSFVHKKAWKTTFNSFMSERNLKKKSNEVLDDFTDDDYLSFVDGKSRYHGVNDFLISRKIYLNYGNSEDSPGFSSVCAIGNLKNSIFNDIINYEGVEVYPSTISFIHQLKGKGVKIGIASSSKNCRNILNKTKLITLFDACTDGNTSVQENIMGKPEPDIFLNVCKKLNVDSCEAIVVEDAQSGVQAAEKGNFGLVIGLARENDSSSLYNYGANIVVSDLSELSLNFIEKEFCKSVNNKTWNLTYTDFVPEKEKLRETLLTTGNGYFASRGCIVLCSANNFHYPGTYMAGLYDRQKSTVHGKVIENEDLVNCPNWSFLRFKVNDGDWVDFDKCKILYAKRNINFSNGELYSRFIIKDDTGKEHLFESFRVVSMSDYHVAAEKYILTPLNYNGKVKVLPGIDCNITNSGVERYNSLNSCHLTNTKTAVKDEILEASTQTITSKINVCVLSKLSTRVNSTFCNNYESYNKNLLCGVEYCFDVNKDDKIEIQRIVSISNSHNSHDELFFYYSYESIFIESSKAWKRIWRKIDIIIEGDIFSQKVVRLNLYHLMVSFSPYNKNFDASIPARGLHGEAYRGHIFWDEVFILPFYCLFFPDSAKAMLMYRYKRLESAKRNAKLNGYKGAMYPWQSGSSGSEETQTIHLNPNSGNWGDDYSYLQRHVSLAIAHNVSQYFHITEDSSFMFRYGFEMYWDICRFWASKATFIESTGKYSINEVMGPDEFHEKYPFNAPKGGLKDNAYTNIMCAKILNVGVNYYEDYYDSALKTIAKLGILQDEIDKWRTIATNLNIIFENDIISQFDGYFNLKDLDLQGYKNKYNDIHRLDRILKAENSSPDCYKIIKQADTMMSFFLLNEREVTSILLAMGYRSHNHYFRKNFDYYFSKTSHGSSLSKLVYAFLAGKLNYDEVCFSLFNDALTSDYVDVQGSSTAEGIHTGVMAGTILTIIFLFAGIDISGKELEYNTPKIPFGWHRIYGRLKFKNSNYRYDIK